MRRIFRSCFRNINLISILVNLNQHQLYQTQADHQEEDKVKSNIIQLKGTDLDQLVRRLKKRNSRSLIT